MSTSRKQLQDMYGGFPVPETSDPERPPWPEHPRGDFGSSSQTPATTYAQDVRQLAAAINRRNAEAMNPGHRQKQRNRADISSVLGKILQSDSQ